MKKKLIKTGVYVEHSLHFPSVLTVSCRVAAMIGQLLSFIILGAFLPVTSAGAKLSFSRTVFIEDEPYYVPEESLASFSGSVSPLDLLPAAVITTNTSTVTDSTLKSIVQSWKDVDDVFTESFLSGSFALIISYLKKYALIVFKKVLLSLTQTRRRQNYHHRLFRIFQVSASRSCLCRTSPQRPTEISPRLVYPA